MATKVKKYAKRTALVRVPRLSGSDYVPSRAHVKLAPGDAVRVIRELQEMTQAELAAATGLAQPTISSIESGRSTLGAERAERLARALKVHPAVLLWPNWDADVESKRAM
jgi:DNA-binding XRE family transcriptional regulator